MEILKLIVLVILISVIMYVGKIFGYSEKSIIIIIKTIIGFEILVKIKVVVHKFKGITQVIIDFLANN